MNWRGTPLVSLAAIVSLIASTHSRSGLRVRSELDRLLLIVAIDLDSS